MPDQSPNCRASALLNALSSPDRLALVSAVAQRQATGGALSLTTVAADLGMPAKALVKEVTRLQECGAFLRRMLVDFGQLTRDGASNYRRAG